MAIDLKTKETPIIEKARELCQTIVDQPRFAELLKAMDTFVGNDAARSLYDEVCTLQDRLVAKQEGGETLTDAEIDEFEGKRDALMENSVAHDFMGARQEIQTLQQTITRYVTKTFDLGRVPLEEELESSGGCCGGGCGGGGGCG